MNLRPTARQFVSMNERRLKVVLRIQYVLSSARRLLTLSMPLTATVSWRRRRSRLLYRARRLLGWSVCLLVGVYAERDPGYDRTSLMLSSAVETGSFTSVAAAMQLPPGETGLLTPCVVDDLYYHDCLLWLRICNTTYALQATEYSAYVSTEATLAEAAEWAQCATSFSEEE